jgi:phosphodiesterase/alkaline phosphatase D-like protein
MLGLTQLDWVKQQLSQAQVDGVVWKVVSVSTPIDVWTDTNNQLDNKSWVAGYNAERNEIMKFIEDIPRLIENPKNSCAEVFLGFDLAV